MLNLKANQLNSFVVTMVFKSRIPFLLAIIFLSVATLSLAYHDPQSGEPIQEYLECQRRCQQQEGQQQQQCQQRCEKQLREQVEGHRGQGGNTRDPQQEYQDCQRRCQQQEGQQQQQQCQQRCERQRREREEGQRGQGGNTRDPQHPQQEYQQCQRRCQKQQGQQQQQCQQQCEQQLREQQEGQRGQGGNTRDPQQEYQECQRRCQKQESQKQQQQCQQRCERQRREREEGQKGQGGNARDPQQEYQECQRRCQQQEGQQQQQQCQQRCERQRREREEGQKGQGGNARDPQQEYQECQRRCQQQEGQQQQQCEQRCERQRREQERDPQQEYQQCQRRCQEEYGSEEQKQQCQQRCEELRQQQQRGENAREQQQSNNPYFLDEGRFVERFRTQHGYTRVSQRFSEISSLLRGIKNYRMGFFEANPSTFMIPHHCDADAVFFVVRGRGTINMVQQQSKESYNLERGDVIRVPAGALLYLINRDNKDKFQIASVFQPVSIPGRFKEFFGVGGENPESFFNTFSDEILEAAFNTPKERLDKMFRQQKDGEIVQASQEQIKALTRDASSSSREGSRSRQGSRSNGPYSLLQQRPEQSNEYGRLYRVGANQYRQLQDLDLEVAFYDIKKGVMVAPFYNSRATSLVMVMDGRGRFEMACPHLSSQGQEQQQQQQKQQEQGQRGSAHYQRVSAQLSPRNAFIVPAGHPVSIVASDDQNLQIVAFKLNAENNQRNYLAGKGNLLNQLEREAKELSFNMPASEVEEILNNQKQFVFLPGPNQRQQQEQREGQHGSFILESLVNIIPF
ncbi:hypothetical protein ACHQM5_023229 [Ranunculus cassubicifolius]